jgi:hypothetical protein
VAPAGRFIHTPGLAPAAFANTTFSVPVTATNSLTTGDIAADLRCASCARVLESIVWDETPLACADRIAVCTNSSLIEANNLHPHPSGGFGLSVLLPNPDRLPAAPLGQHQRSEPAQDMADGVKHWNRLSMLPD